MGLPAERGSQRVNLTQMDPHTHAEHTHGGTRGGADRCKCGHIGAQTYLENSVAAHVKRWNTHNTNA